MPDKLKFAALGYLNNWYGLDQYLVAGLSLEKSNEERRHCLQRVAGSYKIARSFKTLPNEIDRLELALEALDGVKNTIDDKSVDSTVSNLAEAFKEHYGKLAISAASKFLWFRYRSPVVMYDSQARRCLKSLCGKDYATYATYHEEWRKQYANKKDSIAQVCEELIPVKSFSLACDVSDDDLMRVVHAPWFRERVFDWFLWGSGRPTLLS